MRARKMMRMISRRRVLGLAAAVMLVTPAFTLTPPADSELANEYKIKAALSFNFLKFASWPFQEIPEDAAALDLSVEELKIGFLASEEVFGLCRFLEGEAIQDKRIRLIRIEDHQVQGEMKALQDLHVLYITREFAQKRKSLVSDILRALEGFPILTISEIPEFLEKGGMINFFIEENHIVFEINLQSIKRSNLLLKTSVLKLAKRVIQ